MSIVSVVTVIQKKKPFGDQRLKDRSLRDSFGKRALISSYLTVTG